MTVLLACPFCGSTDVHLGEVGQVEFNSWVAAVCCESCEVRLEPCFGAPSEAEASTEALAMRERGEKQAVIHLVFGAGIESAIRRVRERDAGGDLRTQVLALGRKTLVRKKDGQRYRIFQAEGRHIGSRAAAYLVPVWDGRSHWKTHERILKDYEVSE
jgi:hypothetical protein